MTFSQLSSRDGCGPIAGTPCKSLWILARPAGTIGIDLAAPPIVRERNVGLSGHET